MTLIDLKNCTIEIRDGASHKLVVKIGNGNLTYDEKQTIQYIKDRGLLDTTRYGDQEPMDVSLDADWTFLTFGTGDSLPVTIEDALKQRGGASAWTSSDPDPCTPYCVDLYIFNIPPCAGVTPEKIVLPYYRWESIAHDPKAGTLATKGKCNATQAVVTRGAVTS